jgi:hypothetical protein
MEKPKCKECGTRHWPREGHAGEKIADAVLVRARVHPDAADAPAVAVPGVMPPTLELAKLAPAKRGLYPATDARRAYMKEYMRKRRAATKAAKG